MQYTTSQNWTKSLPNCSLHYNNIESECPCKVIEKRETSVLFECDNLLDLSNSSSLITYNCLLNNKTSSPVLSPKPNTIDTIFENIIELYVNIYKEIKIYIIYR